MFFGHPVERLCTYQYSLVTLIPGMITIRSMFQSYSLQCQVSSIIWTTLARHRLPTAPRHSNDQILLKRLTLRACSRIWAFLSTCSARYAHISSIVATFDLTRVSARTRSSSHTCHYSSLTCSRIRLAGFVGARTLLSRSRRRLTSSST